jgi:anti-sigma factor RsiW
MNCTEFAEWTGPWLSGEIEPAERAAFEAHRATCAACKDDLARTIASDEWVRRTAEADMPDPAAVLHRTRLAMARRTAVRRWLAAAAAVVLALGSAAYIRSSSDPARIFVAAARDHKTEVMQGKPRRWRTSDAEIDLLLRQYQLSPTELAQLMPAGFQVEKAKQCGVDGTPALHLVLSDGSRSMSIYVEPQGSRITAGTENMDGVEVASFRGQKISGIVVAASPELCAEAVRRLSAL